MGTAGREEDTFVEAGGGRGGGNDLVVLLDVDLPEVCAELLVILGLVLAALSLEDLGLEAVVLLDGGEELHGLREKVEGVDDHDLGLAVLEDVEAREEVRDHAVSRDHRVREHHVLVVIRLPPPHAVTARRPVRALAASPRRGDAGIREPRLCTAGEVAGAREHGSTGARGREGERARAGTHRNLKGRHGLLLEVLEALVLGLLDQRLHVEHLEAHRGTAPGAEPRSVVYSPPGGPTARCAAWMLRYARWCANG